MFIFQVILSFSLFSQAQQCVDIFAQQRESTFEETQVRPLKLDDVEVYRRNNDIGVQQRGVIHFERWIELGPYLEEAYNFVGLTPEGRVYHVIDWHGQRRIGRLLSGEGSFKDLFVFQGKVLGAIDAQGRIWLYSPQKWSRSPRAILIKRGAAIWAGVTSLVAGTIYAIYPEALHWNISIAGTPVVPLPAAFTAVVSGLQTGFVMLNQFDRLNTYPDGFVRTDLFVETSRDVPAALEGINESHLMQNLLKEDFDVPERGDLPPNPSGEMATEEIR